jgi:hypothetical protein
MYEIAKIKGPVLDVVRPQNRDRPVERETSCISFLIGHAPHQFRDV